MSDKKLDSKFDVYHPPAETQKPTEEEFVELPSWDSLTDETITQEQINELKMLGMSRPAGISSERWWRLQSERGEHTHMIHLAASGIPQGKIAEIIGYDQAHVSKVLNTPEIKQKVQKEISEIYGADHKKALKDRAMKAIEVVDDVLADGKEAERASMAKWVLEHSVGKASQEIIEKKTSLTELIVRIDQMQSSNQLRDVGSSSAALPKTADPFDTVISQVIPKGMTVGKRSENVEGQAQSGLDEGTQEDA